MAKLEYSAECLCGGKIITTFKKPTRMQQTISKATCSVCRSEFMFAFSVEYNDGKRAYMPEHEVTHMTPKLQAVMKAKRAEKLNEKEQGKY